MPKLTTTDLDRMAADDRFLGFGYLGGRQVALTSTDPEAPARPELVAEVDAWVLAYAEQTGLNYEDLFSWANSKIGRWFADSVFGGESVEEAAQRFLAPRRVS